MTPQQARELLGGLSAGILTPDERHSLFEAALHDQALFNELAVELEFAAFLDSPELKAQLASRIAVQRQPERRAWLGGLLQPRWLALSSVLAATCLIFVAVWHRPGASPPAANQPVALQPRTAPSPAESAKAATEPPASPQSTARPHVSRKAKEPALPAAPSIIVDKAAPPASTAEMPKPPEVIPQVAVFDFNVAEPARSTGGIAGSAPGTAAADLLSTHLLDNGRFRVVDREKVQRAMQAQTTTGLPPTPEQAAAVGRSVGADAVIVGTVQPPPEAPAANTFIGVTAEVIDTKAAKPVAGISAGGRTLESAMGALGRQLGSNLTESLQGSVSAITGAGIVTLEFPATTGLRIGSRLDILRGDQKVGEVIVNSLSGRYAVGKFTGATPPRLGDQARRQP